MNYRWTAGPGGVRSLARLGYAFGCAAKSAAPPRTAASNERHTATHGARFVV
jgi:hypothetical protein